MPWNFPGVSVCLPRLRRRRHTRMPRVRCIPETGMGIDVHSLGVVGGAVSCDAAQHGQSIIGSPLFRSPIRRLAAFLALPSGFMSAAADAYACSCVKISPAEASNRPNTSLRQGRRSGGAHLDRRDGASVEGERHAHAASQIDGRVCENGLRILQGGCALPVLCDRREGAPHHVFYHPQVAMGRVRCVPGVSSLRTQNPYGWKT